MINYIKKLYYKWREWEKEERIIAFGDNYLIVSNSVIEVVILVILLMASLYSIK